MWKKIILLCGAMAAAAPVLAGDAELMALSDEILAQSQNLWKQTHHNAYRHERNEAELTETLTAMKALIVAYEKQAGLAREQIIVRRDDPPRPEEWSPEVLGTSSERKDGESVLYTDERTRRIRYGTIKVEHGSGDAFVRIHTITVITAKGERHTFNIGGGKCYLGDSVDVELPQPAFISEIRVHVQHRTGGLRITGLPAPIPVELPTVVPLGTTNGIKDGYAVLNTTDIYRRVKFRKLRIKNTGGDEYVRLSNLEVYAMNGETIAIEINRGKFHPGDVMEVDLPRPLHIKTVRVYAQHRTAGLELEGVR